MLMPMAAIHRTIAQVRVRVLLPLFLVRDDDDCAVDEDEDDSDDDVVKVMIRDIISNRFGSDRFMKNKFDIVVEDV